MSPYKILLISAIIIASTQAFCDKNLIPDLSFKISGAKLAFPCDSTKNIYLSTGRYIQKNIIGTRFQIYKDNVIVALPRLRDGVPFTLAWFSLKSKDTRATLLPYPCWSIQEEGNCDGIQSAVDIVLDQSETLWVLDSGIVNTLEQPVRRCAPKIVGISVKTGQVVKIIDVSQFVTAHSQLQYLAVDFDEEGRAFAYVSDAGAGAIIVYDIFADKGYRVVLPKACVSSAKSKAVLHIALIRKNAGENLLYFSYMSSPRLYYIKTQYLQKGRAAGAVVDVGSKPAESDVVLLGTDNGSGLFFRFKGQSDIYIWNSLSCFKEDNFALVQSGDECRLATQVVPGYKRLMWVIESNFNDFVSNTVGCLGPSVVVHPLIKTCE